MPDNRCLSCKFHRLICGLQGDTFFEFIEFGALRTFLCWVLWIMRRESPLNPVEFGVRS